VRPLVRSAKNYTEELKAATASDSLAFCWTNFRSAAVFPVYYENFMGQSRNMGQDTENMGPMGHLQGAPKKVTL